MWRLAILLWVIGGTVLAGVFLTVVLMMPSLAPMKFIPIAVAIGAVVAIPFAIAAAKAIAAKTA